MWQKPDSEDLMPVFMLEATGLFKALAVYFGIPAVLSCVLLRLSNLEFAFFFKIYANVLREIFTTLNLFYLLHLIPSLLLRYLIYRGRFSNRGAFFVSALIALLALLIVYPLHSILNPKVLTDIILYVALSPFLMALFTLRINRLSFLGGSVIVLFIALLGSGFI